MPKKIMIVEDEHLSAFVIEDLLKNNGYSIFGIFAAGEDAIKAVEKECPDLILMDITLLGSLNGIETARLIEQQCNVDIIYITASNSVKIENEVKQVKNFKGIVGKPYDKPLLLRMIEKALNEEFNHTSG